MNERGNPLLRMLDRRAGIPLVAFFSILRKFAASWKSCSAPPAIGILCLGAIGDLLLLSPLINGIRKLLPMAHIQLVTSKANACAIPLIKNIDSAFSASVTDIFQLVRHIRRQRFDLLVDTGQWARISAVLQAASGAKMLVGFSTPGQCRHYALDLKIPHSQSCHEADNFMSLGKAVWPNIEAIPGLSLPPWRERHRAVFCHMYPAPGPGRHLKEWPEKYWKALIRYLLRQNYRIFLTGSKVDAPACQSFIKRYFNGNANICSLAAELTLKELGDAFCSGSGVISVNTGIMHLAALSGTPTLGLHGATNPLRWGPTGPKAISLVPRRGQHSYLNLGHEYPRDAIPAMKFLPLGDVLRALRSLF